MGLFKRKRRAEPARDDAVARSVLVPAVATMFADGEASAVEIEQLRNVCGFSPIFVHYGGAEIGAIVKDIADELRQHGGQRALANAARHLSPALRETAMCFAIRIALADGELDPEETETLLDTSLAMQIEAGTYIEMLKVVSMMQRPATAA